MIRRGTAPAFALLTLAIVAIAAIACGTSASTPAEPTTDPAPTASGDLEPDVRPPGFAPGGRGGLPDGAEGLGRGTRFVPLDNPAFVSADEATFLTPDDRVLGVAIGGESRAYPISMMTFHHVANDELGGLPVLVTF